MTPLFLLGLTAIAIPIVIHLRRSHKTEVQAFPSLMFLRPMEIRSRRRRRIHNWLLLALRSLVLAFLVVAFARPWLDAAASDPTVGGEGRTIVILLDTSFSMGFDDRWARAKSAAREVAAAVSPTDRMSVISFDETATVRVRDSDDPALLQQTIDEIELSSRATRYAPALRAAARIVLESDRRGRQVVMLTDFQRTGWQADERSRLPAGTEVSYVDLGTRSSPPSNLAVSSVIFQRNMRSERERVSVQARVINRGGELLRGVTATLYLNGREVEEQSFDLDADNSSPIGFQPFSLPAGQSSGSIELRGDRLAADNRYSFVLSRAQAIPLLVVEGSRVGGPSSGFYVAQSLRLSQQPPFDVETVNSRRLTAELVDAAEVVILSDIGRPSAAVGGALVRHVEQGGGLMIALGSRSNEAALIELASLGLIPSSNAGSAQRGAGSAPVRISYFDRSHPGYEVFAQPRSGDFSAARFFRHHRLRIEEGRDRVLARFDNGEVALVERKLGRGRVLVWASTLDRYWNDFPLKAVFVPFLHQSVNLLARYEGLRPSYTVGTVLDVAALRSPEEDPASESPAPVTRIIDPGGGRLESQDLLTLENGGFYRIEFDDGAVGTLAVNLEPSESDLASFDPAEFTAGLAPDVARPDSPASSGEQTPVDLERAQGLWRYLILIVAVLLIAETLLSNRSHHRVWRSESV